jgi:hypothetical protein
MGTLYIDGADAFTSFGVFVEDVGYKGIVQYPPLKTPDSNDWAESDGMEVDLTDTKLDSKTFGIEFAGVLDFSVRNLIDYLSDDAYHEFNFAEIGVTRTLRLTGNPNRYTVGTLKTFTLDFADDYPLAGYSYLAPSRVASCWQTGFELDGKPLSDYGVWIRDGAHDELVKSPSVKQNLLVNTPAMNGAQYDGEDVFFQAKDVKIACHIRADIPTFWRNYNALLYDLTKPGERLFFYGARNEEYPCHYKSASVSTFTLTGGDVWCDFDLMLAFTAFRLGEVEYVLANADGALIALDNSGILVDTSLR